MQPIADDFLLHVAEISASLLGLFFVGVFLYVQTVLGRRHDGVVESPYIRSSAQVVIVLSAISIGMSLALIALEPRLHRLLFIGLSLLLVVATLERIRRFRALPEPPGPLLLAGEVIATASSALVVALPWILGRLEPTREDLTWSVLLAFASGLFSIWGMVMIAFDIGSRGQGDERPTSS